MLQDAQARWGCYFSLCVLALLSLYHLACHPVARGVDFTGKRWASSRLTQREMTRRVFNSDSTTRATFCSKYEFCPGAESARQKLGCPGIAAADMGDSGGALVGKFRGISQLYIFMSTDIFDDKTMQLLVLCCAPLRRIVDCRDANDGK